MNQASRTSIMYGDHQRLEAALAGCVHADVPELRKLGQSVSGGWRLAAIRTRINELVAAEISRRQAADLTPTGAGA
jgi:hypothetical protein